MAGWLTNGFQNLATFFGGEKFPIDTNLPNGVQPQSAKVSLQSLAAAFLYLSNNASKTTVAGTRYYSSLDVNAPNPSYMDGGAEQLAPVAKITGIQVLVGSVGGTDNWIVELHNSSGVVVATSAATLAGTAGTWQQIPFTSPVTLVPDTYFIVVQSNGTTAHPAVYNFPAPVAAQAQLITGSVAGTFNAPAPFTPTTTYTANLGPVGLLY